MTAPLQPAEPTLTAAYMETCKDRPADHNEIGLFYFLQGWHKSRLAMKGAQQAQPEPLLSDAEIVRHARVVHGLFDDLATEFQTDDILKFGRAIEAAVIAKQAASPESMARRFHDAYERLAPSFGYVTREETRVFDPDSANGKLMIAVCAAIAAPTTTEVKP